jgi:hypothetical protein
MKFLSLAPFVPSGSNYEESRHLFRELGFTETWEADGMAGFSADTCHFILQKFHNKSFAENFMLTVRIDNADEFRKSVIDKGLPERFGIRVGNPTKMPYGIEVNIIDIAGVCWHFVQ